jgi:hypothetical protein
MLISVFRGHLTYITPLSLTAMNHRIHPFINLSPIETYNITLFSCTCATVHTSCVCANLF